MDTLVIENTHFASIQPSIGYALKGITQKFFKKTNNPNNFFSERILSYKEKTFKITISKDKGWYTYLLTDNGWTTIFSKDDLVIEDKKIRMFLSETYSNIDSNDDFADEVTEQFIKLIILVY